MEHEQGSKLAVVLGSGAARGLAHIGLLKVLEKKGIKPDIIVGSSMGAMIGGAYAAGLTATQLEEIACRTNWKKVVQILFPRRVRRDGLLDGDRVEEFLISLLGEEDIEDLPLRFACVATDLLTGAEIVLNSGSLINAIRASISFPFLFQPVKIGEHYLIDGGVVNPVPVSVARLMGAQRVIACKVTPSVEQRARQLNSGQLVTKRKLLAAGSSSSFLQRLFGDMLERMRQERNNGQAQKAPKLGLQKQMAQVAMTMENMILSLRLQQSAPDVLISPEVSEYQFFDFKKAEEIIRKGEQAAVEALERDEV